jgi:3-hydroxyisobutyrate dehydrogenase
MLPNGAVVRDVLLGIDGVAPVLAQGSLIIDMSSSAPAGSRELAIALRTRSIDFIDAPVSGGVRRAETGSLAIIAGGKTSDVERAKPILEAMGKSIIATGPIGSGHAMKALNNYVSAAGLTAACDAVIIGREFGIAPETIVDVLNASTGLNNSTAVKLKPFILSGSFCSGFAMALMAKDIRTAAELAEQLRVSAKGLEHAAALWDEAATTLGAAADHTEIFRFLSEE